MNQPRISELKNSTPIEQLMVDLVKQSTHQAPDKSTFVAFVKSNYPTMFVDEIKRIFKSFEANQFTAVTTDTYSFTEWFARVISGYRGFKAVQEKEIHKTDADFYPELYNKMTNESVRLGVVNFRPDIAVYGYEMFKQRGEIPNVAIENTKEFQTFQKKFVQERRDNGATLYDLTFPQNMNVYKSHIKIHIFVKRFKEMYKLEL